MPSIPRTPVLNQGQEMPGVQSATQKNLDYGHYFQCSEVVLHSKLLSFRARCVYEQLLCHAREKDTCYPGHETLARELGKSVDTIQRGLKELREMGFIRWRRRGLTKTNVYTIVEFTEVDAVKNFLPPKRPHACKNSTTQECSTLKPQECGTKQNQSNNPQLESDESLSNALGGMVETTPAAACSQGEQSARGNTQQERTTPPADKSTPASASSSHRNNTTSPLSHRDPSPPNRTERSNRESSSSRETGRQRQSFFKKDEVRREARELPRMKPLTQDEIDAKRRMGQNASGQTPLQAILNEISPPEHQEMLARQFGERGRPSHTSGLQCPPMPVYQELQRAVERISVELGDFHHAKSNITRTDNIRREADVPLEQLLVALSEAHHATRVASQKESITKRDESGRPIKMSYFFAVLRQKLGLPPKVGQVV